MKVVSALIGFVVLIFIPFSGAVECVKTDLCITKEFNSPFDPNNVTKIDCDVCAVWACLRNGKVYTGSGCKGDDNICKNGKNQDEPYSDDKSCYNDLPAMQDSKDPVKDGNEGLQFRECAKKLINQISAHGECTPNEGKTFSSNERSKTETTTSKDKTKTGALTIVGMLLLGWLFVSF